MPPPLPPFEVAKDDLDSVDRRCLSVQEEREREENTAVGEIALKMLGHVLEVVFVGKCA